MTDCDDFNVMMDDEQQLRSRMKPNPSIDDVIDFVSLHWIECGTIKKASTQRIDSYDDANFYCEAVDTRDGNDQQQYRSYLIKCYNAVETCTTGSSNLLHGLGLMLSRINEKINTDLQVPTIVMPHNNSESNNYMLMDECLVSDGSHQQVAVRLFKWIPGYVC